MNKKNINFSYVAVWNQPMTMIPQLDGKFCRELFGMPYETVNGLTPDGYTIAVNNKPFPMVVISPARLVVKAQNVEKLIEYVELVKRELEKINVPNFTMTQAAFGINQEYELLDLNESSEQWMWNHFIDGKIKTESDFHTCGRLSLRVGITDNQVANIEIEPRLGIDNAIFVNINHHHSLFMETIPDAESLRKLIDSSLTSVEAKIFDKLFK